jgi:hypothetical protein
MRKIEEILGLPESQTIVEDKTTELKTIADENEQRAKREANNPLQKTLRDYEKIADALPKVKGLGDASDLEFDELARRATEAYDDLMDLGMNVEARYASKIFEVASSMLKNAIDAKTAKIEKKLRMVDLQLKKYRMDKGSKQDGDMMDVSGPNVIVSDRNSLLEKIKKLNQEP